MIQPKGLNIPRILPIISATPDGYVNRDSEMYPERGITYEEDPEKLEALMAETDRKREEAHKKLSVWRRV
jgi:hypothetical protein